MTNRETDAAWAYHNFTKHSQESLRSSRHYLDWANQPIPFKIYPTLEPIPLVQELSSSGVAAVTAIALPGTSVKDSAQPTHLSLAEILFLSAGITKRRVYPGGEILFRAAACTGALYHIDLYLVCGDLDGLDAGVYHFSPQDFSLRRLRAGDHRSILVAATGDEPAIAQAPCVIASASTFWRNAWKYQSRAYRHCYWDNGTILANLMAAAAARRIAVKLALGFVDPTVSDLLGLDKLKEAPLSLVALGESIERPMDSTDPVETITFETTPLSATEVDYPAMREMHNASSLTSADEVAEWRALGAARAGRRSVGPATTNPLFPLPPAGNLTLPQVSLEEVIGRRGSTREFSREPIGLAELTIMLNCSTQGIQADFLCEPGDSLSQIYLIVHAVDGLTPGAYVYHADARTLELLRPGEFRRQAGELGLGQDIPADCSVNVYFLADLNAALARFGSRGYRAAQLEAAIRGGKLYLAAYAQRLGASGLTFFDDQVTEFFSPHAAGKSVMFLIALGKSVKRARENP